MALMDRFQLRPLVERFRHSLQRAALLRPEIPPVPEPGSSTLYYSHWFATLNFLIQIQEDARERAVPGDVVDAANDLGSMMAGRLNVPIIAVPAQLNLGGLGYWVATLSTATAGDNWCWKNSHGGSSSHMEINREDSSDLTADCNDAGHFSEYEAR